MTGRPRMIGRWPVAADRRLPRGPSRRLALLVAALSTLVLLGFGCRGPAPPPTPPATSARPNVVLIVADDMRADSVWPMQELGRLAARGVTFDRFFVTTPTCCPSRASIMTGLYAHHHGVHTNGPPDGGVQAFDDRSTLATWVRGVGVRTGLVGRYLNGYESLDVPPGWDWWFALWQTNEEYGSYYDYRVTDGGERRYFGSKPEAYSTRVLGQQAIKFLEADRDRPFLLMLTPRAPHNPATPDPEDAGTFKDLELPLPPSYFEEDVSDKPRWVREFHGLDRKRERAEKIELFRRRQLETLLGLDRLIGSLVETLRADGRLDNTWIFFTADNGLMLGEHRLDIGKSCPYEECVRVPLIVVPPSGPGAGRTDDRLAANIDLAPTIAEIMGATPGAAVDGQSLLPLLRNPSAAGRDELVLEQRRDEDGKSFVGLRTPDRKYVRYADDGEELYDHAADPYELQNLAGDPSRAEEKARLEARLDALLAAPPASPPGR